MTEAEKGVTTTVLTMLAIERAIASTTSLPWPRTESRMPSRGMRTIDVRIDVTVRTASVAHPRPRISCLDRPSAFEPRRSSKSSTGTDTANIVYRYTPGTMHATTPRATQIPPTIVTQITECSL